MAGFQFQMMLNVFNMCKTKDETQPKHHLRDLYFN